MSSGLKILLTLFLTWITIFQLTGQNSYEQSVEDTSEVYHINHSDLLSVKFFGVLKSNQISHYDNWTKSYANYRPNENFNIGLGAVYKWFGLDLAFSFPFINNDDEVFGKTSRFDIQTSIYLPQVVADFNFQRYRGYYGSNVAAYDPNFDIRNPVYPIRSDISSFNMALNGQYIFRPDKFSYRAAFVYSERQIKSGGSFLTGAYLSYFTMNADSTIIPSQLRQSFNPSADFRGSKYINTGLSGGYGHTFIVKNKFFFSLSLVIGLGPTWRTSPNVLNQDDKTDLRVATRIVVRSSIGYNIHSFYAGLSVISAQSTELDPLEAHLERNINNVKLFIGKRIHPPRLLRRIFKTL